MLKALITRHVRSDVSSLIVKVANGAHDVDRTNDGVGRELADLAEQAAALAAPVLDYESAAREAGWATAEDEDGDECYVHAVAAGSEYADNWADLCARDCIEPHDREVYEHHAVTDWLADTLEAHGEKVDRDFAGIAVWARTGKGPLELDPALSTVVAALQSAAAKRLFNCCTDHAEPDWSRFSGLELAGCRDGAPAGVDYTETIEGSIAAGEAEFFTVYGRELVTGLAKAITDACDPRDALAVAGELALVSGLACSVSVSLSDARAP